MSAPRAELLRLLAECKQHPEDDAARLVLADWLEEHGDEDDRERSAFVRFQVSACPEKLGTGFTLWPGHRWDRSVRRWAPFHSSRRPARSYRGLVHVSLDPKLAAGPRAEATARVEPWAWVEGVSINGTRTPLPALLSSSLLDTVASVHIFRMALEAKALAERFRPAWRALDLGSVSLGAGGLTPLLRSSATAGLRNLSLYSTSLDWRDVAALTDSLPALEGLTLPGTEAWGELLARAGWQLRSLAAWNGNADALVRAAAGSGACAGLRAFHITNGYGGAEALHEAQFWPTLEGLGLDGPMLSGGGAERLASVPAAPRLRRVSLTGTSAGPAGLRALASWPGGGAGAHGDARGATLVDPRGLRHRGRGAEGPGRLAGPGPVSRTDPAEQPHHRRGGVRSRRFTARGGPGRHQSLQ
jgi:uncharacterized protein (TIGR02996 family)